MNKQVTLLNYTGNEENWGCQATSEGLFHIIHNTIKTDNIFVVPIEDENVTSFKILYRKITRVLKRPFINNKIVENNKILQDMLKFCLLNLSMNKQRYRAVLNSERVILNGEGSIHNYGRMMIVWFFYLWAAKKIFNKHISVINHSIQFDDEKAKSLIQSVYKIVDEIVVREPISIEKLKSIGIDNVKLSGDAAFLATPCDDEQITKLLSKNNIPEQYICMAGSVIIEKLPLEKNIRLIQEIMKKYNMPVVFTGSCYIDRRRMVELKKAIPELILLEKEYSYKEIMGVIKNSKLFITGRFHPMIFSIITNTPFVAYKSNTIKMEGVVSMVKYPIDILDFETLSIDEIIQNIDHVLENYDQIKETLERGYQEVREQTLNTYSKCF